MKFLLEEVQLRFPYVIDVMTDCRKGSEEELLIFTNDGRVLSYNDLDKTIRNLPYDPNDMTKEQCQSEFGKRLWNMMWIKRMTQEELSEITGIHQVMISNYVNGNHCPNFYYADKIAKALGCSMEEFRYVL